MNNTSMSGDLGINTEVIKKMVAMATLEVEGVAALANRALDIKGIVNNGSPFNPVKVTMKNGAEAIDVYVTVKSGVNAKAVAEAVQHNVKDKVQDMTGSAVTRVNVHIADFEEEAE